MEWKKAPWYVREMELDRHPEYRYPVNSSEALNQPVVNVHRALEYIWGMNKEKCKELHPDQLVLNGGEICLKSYKIRNNLKLLLYRCYVRCRRIL